MKYFLKGLYRLARNSLAENFPILWRVLQYCVIAVPVAVVGFFWVCGSADFLLGFMGLDKAPITTTNILIHAFAHILAAAGYIYLMVILKNRKELAHSILSAYFYVRAVGMD